MYILWSMIEGKITKSFSNIFNLMESSQFTSESIFKEAKKGGMILVTVNMFFILITFFGYSVISLVLLFFFFVSLLGMGLNVIYRATNDQNNEQE